MEFLYKTLATAPKTKEEGVTMRNVNYVMQGLDAGLIVFMLSKWGPTRVMARAGTAVPIFAIYKWIVPDGYAVAKPTTTSP
jgi:hypothetical protein